MKKASFIQYTACVLIALGMTSVYAHGDSDDLSAASQVPVSPTSGPKEIRRANLMLAKSVRRALVKVKGLDSTNVVVLAKNGDIVVGGSVPDSSQIPLAISTAQGVADVKSVKNALTIKRR